MNARELILSSIPEPKDGAAPEPWASETGVSDVVEQFIQMVKESGAEVMTWEGLNCFSDSSWCLDAGIVLPGRLSKAKSKGPFDADIGVCRADFAVAETGSLGLLSGPGRQRLVSLAPLMNVVLVPKCRIVGTLAEGFTGIGHRTAVLVTGPSRTADIEGELVHGVHGPGRLVVVMEPAEFA